MVYRYQLPPHPSRFTQLEWEEAPRRRRFTLRSAAPYRVLQELSEIFIRDVTLPPSSRGKCIRALKRSRTIHLANYPDCCSPTGLAAVLSADPIVQIFIPVSWATFEPPSTSRAVAEIRRRQRIARGVGFSLIEIRRSEKQMGNL